MYYCLARDLTPVSTVPHLKKEKNKNRKKRKKQRRSLRGGPMNLENQTMRGFFWLALADDDMIKFLSSWAFALYER
ncbi:unnamed protein product [Brassica oleracea var. botrytis]